MKNYTLKQPKHLENQLNMSLSLISDTENKVSHGYMAHMKSSLTPISMASTMLIMDVSNKTLIGLKRIEVTI
jgi:hypothetical protein